MCLYLFFWDNAQYPFDIADAELFIPVATFAAPKPDGTFCERPTTLYFRRDFERGSLERGFMATDSLSIPPQYQVKVLRPDLVVEEWLDWLVSYSERRIVRML